MAKKKGVKLELSKEEQVAVLNQTLTEFNIVRREGGDFDLNNFVATVDNIAGLVRMLTALDFTAEINELLVQCHAQLKKQIQKQENEQMDEGQKSAQTAEAQKTTSTTDAAATAANDDHGSDGEASPPSSGKAKTVFAAQTAEQQEAQAATTDHLETSDEAIELVQARDEEPAVDVEEDVALVQAEDEKPDQQAANEGDVELVQVEEEEPAPPAQTPEQLTAQREQGSDQPATEDEGTVLARTKYAPADGIVYAPTAIVHGTPTDEQTTAARPRNKPPALPQSAPSEPLATGELELVSEGGEQQAHSTPSKKSKGRKTMTPTQSRAWRRGTPPREKAGRADTAAVMGGVQKMNLTAPNLQAPVDPNAEHKMDSAEPSPAQGAAPSGEKATPPAADEAATGSAAKAQPAAGAASQPPAPTEETVAGNAVKPQEEAKAAEAAKAAAGVEPTEEMPEVDESEIAAQAARAAKASSEPPMANGAPPADGAPPQDTATADVAATPAATQEAGERHSRKAMKYALFAAAACVILAMVLSGLGIFPFRAEKDAEQPAKIVEMPPTQANLDKVAAASNGNASGTPQCWKSKLVKVLLADSKTYLDCRKTWLPITGDGQGGECYNVTKCVVVISQ